MKLPSSFLFAVLSLVSTLATGKTITVVAGANKPPYIYTENGKPAGYEVELVTAILAEMDLTPDFHFIPYARSMKMLADDNVDAVMTASPLVFKDKTILTKPYINYQNVVVSLSKNELNINHVDELGLYSMAAFQTASKVLGQSFEVAASVSPFYIELPEQVRQLQMLQQGKVSALVMDVNIFTHFKAPDYPDVTIASVFPISYYGMAFNDPNLVRQFNKTWHKFRKTEQYRQLKIKYKMQQRF